MKKYRVFARMREWSYIDVESETIEDAERIASETDGGDFTPCQNGDWIIESVEAIED